MRLASRGRSIDLRISHCLVFAFLAAAPPLAAQSIFLQAPALGCGTAGGSNALQVLSWSVGVSQSGSGTPTFSNLSVTKPFDECSTAFFGSSAAGKTIPSLTLTQTDKNRVAQTIIQLTNATVTSDGSGGANGSVNQTLSFSYDKICITNPAAQSSYCYDLTMAAAARMLHGRHEE